MATATASCAYCNHEETSDKYHDTAVNAVVTQIGEHLKHRHPDEAEKPYQEREDYTLDS